MEVMFAECSLEHVNGIRGRALTTLSLRSSKGGRTRPAVGEGVGGELGQSDPRRARIYITWGYPRQPAVHLKQYPYRVWRFHRYSVWPSNVLKDHPELYRKQPKGRCLGLPGISQQQLPLCNGTSPTAQGTSRKQLILHLLPTQTSSTRSFFLTSWRKSLEDPSAFSV